ncbi:MAG TPA: hypothetical protein VI413_05840 [Paludibacter sp.]
MITIDQLRSVMKFQLNNFNNEGVSIDDSTIHSTVLSEDDGFSHVNSVQMYKDVIRFTLLKQGHTLKKWPAYWLSLSVFDLSNQII